jgi:hypothetical protein
MTFSKIEKAELCENFLSQIQVAKNGNMYLNSGILRKDKFVYVPVNI